MQDRKKLKLALTLFLLVIVFIFLYWADGNLDSFKKRILNLSAVFVVLTLSINLVIG